MPQVKPSGFFKKFLNYVALGGGMMLNPWQNLAARNESWSRPSSVPHGGEEGKARVVKGRGKKRKYEDSTAQAPSLLTSLARSDNRAGRNVSQKLRFGWDISTPEGAITRNLARGNLDSILVVVARFPSNRSRSG